MTNDQTEFKLKQIELQIAGAHRLHEEQMAYLESWRTDITPRHELLRDSNQGITAFSQAALRSTFLLNGGALIALPALGEFFHLENTANLTISIAWFVTGLVLTTLATFCGYVSMRHEADRLDNAIEVVKITVNERHHPTKHTKDYEKLRNDAKTSEGIAQGRAHKWSLSGIGLFLLSVVVFVIGAVTGFLTLQG